MIRSTHDIRAKLQRAYGRCYDCFGKGERKDIVGRLIPCPSCNGSGKISEYTACQLAQSAELTVARTIDALLDLEEHGVATRRNESGADMWRIKRPRPIFQNKI